MMMPSPALIVCPGDLDVLGGHPPLTVLDDRQVAQQLLDGVGYRLGVPGVAQDGELLGVLQQREHPDADHVRGGLVTRQQQAAGQLRGLLDADLTGFDPLGQIRHRVLGGVVHLGLHEVAQVLRQAHHALHVVLGGGIAGQPDVGVFLEESVVFVRDAEHLADHQRRDRQSQRADELGRLGSGEDGVDVIVGDLLDGRAQALHPLEGERLGQHPAVERVFLGVGGEHRPRALVDGGEHALVPVREPGLAVVDADPGVREQRPRLFVAGDQPRGAAVPDAHPAQRCDGGEFHHLGRRRERAPAGALHRILRRGRGRLRGSDVNVSDIPHSSTWMA